MLLRNRRSLIPHPIVAAMGFFLFILPDFTFKNVTSPPAGHVLLQFTAPRSVRT